MRLMVSILAGFVVGFLALGSLVEWVLDLTAGRCDIGCAGWRHTVFIGTAAMAWALVSRFVYLWWGRAGRDGAPPTTDG